jgi:branched-chain amino acid transport system ATP-binding protein
LLAIIMEKIAELNARGITFLIIEHNMDLVMTLCRPVMVLAQGRKLLEGPPEQVKSDPRVIEAYLGGSDDRRAEAPQVPSTEGLNRIPTA